MSQNCTEHAASKLYYGFANQFFWLIVCNENYQGVFMPLYKLNHFIPTEKAKRIEGAIQIDSQEIIAVSQKISTDEKCRDRTLTLRILLNVIGTADQEGKLEISAEQLAEEWGVNCNAVVKSLDYLQRINALQES